MSTVKNKREHVTLSELTQAYEEAVVAVKRREVLIELRDLYQKDMRDIIANFKALVDDVKQVSNKR